MNFPLIHIELHIDDAFVEIGERLLANGRINGLFETEKNLWSANVQEGKAYEVEIQLSNKKVKAYTCDCATFKKSKVCSHITGVLLLLRQNIKEKEEAPEKKKKAAPPQQKLTVNNILKNINADDLEIFVRAYARGNRNFALALKAKFASNITLDNNKDKYKQILDTATNIHKPKKGINIRTLNSILNVVKELLNQADDTIVMRNFTEATAIVEAVLSRMGPINKKGDNFPEWKKTIHRTLQLTKEILEKNVAPDLQEYIWDLLKYEAAKSFYRKANLEADFFEILMDLATDSGKLNELILLADEQLESRDLSNQNIVNLIALKLAIYEKEGKKKKAKKLIEENLANPSILLIAINSAIDKDNFKSAKQLAKAGLDLDPSKNVVLEIEKALLRVAKKENDQAKIEKYATTLFLSTFNFDYFDLLALAKEMDKKQINKLIKQIQEQPYTIQKRDAIAELYFRYDRYKDLLNYIKSIRSLDLLKIYDAALLGDHKKQVYAFYEDFLNSYLTNHIGRIPAVRVSQFIHHLRSIGAHDLVSKLIKDFRASYSERHTLMEELEFF